MKLGIAVSRLFTDMSLVHRTARQLAVEVPHLTVICGGEGHYAPVIRAAMARQVPAIVVRLVPSDEGFAVRTHNGFQIVEVASGLSINDARRTQENEILHHSDALIAFTQNISATETGDTRRIREMAVLSGMPTAMVRDYQSPSDAVKSVLLWL